MDLNKEFRKTALDEGADYFGVADLSSAHGFIKEQGGNEVASYLLAISLGIRIIDSIVDQLPQREGRAVAVNYRHHGYDIINRRLDLLASRISSQIQNNGYKALLSHHRNVMMMNVSVQFFPQISRSFGWSWMDWEILYVDHT